MSVRVCISVMSVIFQSWLCLLFCGISLISAHAQWRGFHHQYAGNTRMSLWWWLFPDVNIKEKLWKLYLSFFSVEYIISLSSVPYLMLFVYFYWYKLQTADPSRRVLHTSHYSHFAQPLFTMFLLICSPCLIQNITFWLWMLRINWWLWDNYLANYGFQNTFSPHRI